jgi:hypothetical protein
MDRMSWVVGDMRRLEQEGSKQGWEELELGPIPV